MKKTKIICTLGPSTDGEGVMEEMIRAGMDIARMNFSHGTWEEHAERIRQVRRAGKKLHRPIGILLDTKGPEIRTGLMRGGSAMLEEGARVKIVTEPVEGGGTAVCFDVNYPELPWELAVGEEILIDDGLLRLKVLEKSGEALLCEVVNGGALGSHKGVNLPGAKISLPAVTKQDEADIRFGLERDVDFIAASFVRSKEAILRIREICKECEKDVGIIAKIENQEGLRHIEEIIDAADGIMIARGDLGVEIPPEDVPYLQKRIIAKCNFRMKPVITATQMLDSMIRNPMPTRAETADVANAIYDGTDAVMLSGETAAGKFPAASVRMMAKIAVETEKHLPAPLIKQQRDLKSRVTIASVLAHMSVEAAEDLGASCILASTLSGTTARYLSKFRPACLIAGMTPDVSVMRRMQLYWGVYPVFNEKISGTDEMISSVVEKAKREGFLRQGDVCILTAGIAAKENPYTTNLIRAFRLG